MNLHKAMPPDKLLVLHHGALGDLLCAWPALLALARAFSGTRRYALTRPSHHFFLRPLGYIPCPEELRDVECAFHGESLPPAADRGRLFRFCLKRFPAHIPEGAHCLAAISEEAAPVFQTLLAQLEFLGISIPGMEESLDLFRTFFGRWQGSAERLAGIFPGSGHRAKNWPLEHFAELARKLGRDGWQPVQILGPAELERGIRLPGVPERCPQDFAELADSLLAMRFAFGNDSGPLHLAAWLGVPCATLFGPSDARRWKPPGASCLCSPLPCAPCTDDMLSPGCDAPECMERISVDSALLALRELARATSA